MLKNAENVRAKKELFIAATLYSIFFGAFGYLFRVYLEWSFLAIAITLTCFVVALAIAGYFVTPENMGSVGILLGRAYKERESGIGFRLFGLEKIRFFTKRPMEFEFDVDNLFTDSGFHEGRKLGEITMKGKKVKIYVQWGDLFKAVTFAPDPDNRKELEEYFVPPVKDAIKTIAAKYPWKMLYTSQDKIPHLIVWLLLNDANDPYVLAGIANQVNTKDLDIETDKHGFPLDKEGKLTWHPKHSPPIKLMLPDLDLPQEMINAFNEEEAAKSEKEASKTRAEAENYRMTEEGKGKAAAALEMMKAEAKGEAAQLKVIGKNAEAAKIRSLEKGMASPSSKIILDIRSILDGLMGSKNEPKDNERGNNNDNTRK